MATLGQEFLRQYPLSDRALGTTLSSLSMLRRWDEAESALTGRLKATPEDRAGLRSISMIAMYHDDYGRVIDTEERVVANGEATSGDMNSLARAALCAGRLTAESIETAQNAVKTGKAQEFAPLQTLAAVYAEIDKTTEARETMLRGMEVGRQMESDSESW